MDVSIEMEPTLRQWVSPRLIEANHILSLSAVELEQAIMKELEENPALDVEEHAICPRCGGALEENFCPTCNIDQRIVSVDPSWEDDADGFPMAPAASRDDEEFDPMTLVASEMSLIQQILSDVATLIQACDLPIAEYMLNSLDERGYLEVSVDYIAELTGRSVEEIERILKAVQQVAPVGVAARDVRECLLLQLAYLKQTSDKEIPSSVWSIVASHLDDLAAHRYSHIARQLGLTTADISGAHEFIRSYLTPFPLQNQEARWWKTPTRAPYVAPDVIVSVRDDEFIIEMVQSRATKIRLDPTYEGLAVEVNRLRDRYSPEERSHIRQHVTRARHFIATIQQRHETLKKITQCLLELQSGFVLHGIRELRPLTRGQVAERVGVHESTVSRATANKYMMLPNGQVVPFSTFFVASLSTKDMIKEMISSEKVALTDKEICERLQAQGVRIARRTVAKYRATIGILPSMLR